jgi:hypothetical protein
MAILNIEITDLQKQILEHRMLDVQAWLDEAVANNIDLAEQGLLKMWLPKLDYPEVSGGKDGMIAHILAQPDYKTRKQRDAEEAGGAR